MGVSGVRGAPVEKADPVRNTARTLTEIEVALAQSDYFNFVRNTVAFNVYGESAKLPLFHECDMLVLRPSGYLIEVEIKRSWSDFLADFHKKHAHDGGESKALLKEFWYCIPSGCLEDAERVLGERGRAYSGIVTYDEGLRLRFRGGVPLPGFRKLTDEERFQVARFGAMRCVQLRKKLIGGKSAREKTLQAKINDLKARESALLCWIRDEAGVKFSKAELRELYYG